MKILYLASTSKLLVVQINSLGNIGFEIIFEAFTAKYFRLITNTEHKTLNKHLGLNDITLFNY